MDSVLKIEKPNPFDNSNFFSRIYFGWMLNYCYIGVKRTLKLTDLYKCCASDRSETLTNKIDGKWKEELEKVKAKSLEPNLFSVIFKLFGPYYFFIGILVFVVDGVLRAFQPVILSLFIRQFSYNSQGTFEEKLIYGSILVGVSTIFVFTRHRLSLASAQIGMRMRVACCSLIYRKLLRLSTRSLHETSSGQVVNLLSNDVNRFDMLVVVLHFLWIMPFQIILLTYLIWREASYSAFVGVFAMLISTLPVQGAIAKMSSMYRLKVAQRSDKRIKLMGQLIEGIQVVKMYVWEDALADTVKNIRESEIDSLIKSSYLRGVLSSMSIYMERFVTFVTIVAFILFGNQISADVVFALASFYNTMQLTTAIYYPLALLFLSETKVSVNRIQKFLMLAERQEMEISLKNDGGVSLKDVEAFWDPEIPVLQNIRLNIPKGSLCAIVGPVGSGKSTLLQLLLGEVTSYKGSVEIGGTISYASQEAWIFASTVRKNILFGQEYDKFRYKEVVDVCALKTDFKLFPQTDKTIVGEKGISLSGGQRARISLARTVYRKADIYLLDDPLSAVDAHVGKHLFEKCILKFLKRKTRILVTHQLQYLKSADQILVLDNNGRIEACGTFDELSKSDLDFTKLLSSAEEDIEEQHFERDPMRTSVLSVMSDDFEEDHLTKNAESFDSTTKSSFWAYAKSANSVWGLIFTLLVMIVSQIVVSGGDYWLSFWTGIEDNRSASNSTSSDDPISDFFTTQTSLIFYSVIILATLLLPTFRCILFYKYALKASKNLHGAMFTSLLKAPMSFFNINPMGRILNRFAKDIGTVDEVFPRLLLDAISVILILSGILFNVSISNPWMLVAGFILGLASIIIFKCYVAVAKDTRHLEGITKSPVFSHVSATFNGLVTIRSTKCEKVLTSEFDQHQDAHSSGWFLTIACIYAFGFWLDFMALLFVYAVTYSFILFSRAGTVSDSAVGLAVQQSLVLTGFLAYGLRQIAEMISNMTAVDRVLDYTKLGNELDGQENKTLPRTEWPSRGQIVFKNLYLIYSEVDPPVLKNLNFTVEAGEKVGIVGRTGAGKTSLIGALFLLEKIEGNIFIDGVDTQSILLKEVRKHISIIPQEPVLLNETVRYNLDPFNEYDDKKIWIALEEVELKDSISTLDMLVQEGGSNFSVGQRQLMCLARAILRNNRILVLDEATANVDPKTDALIQNTIRRKFKNFTVLTIAHRLNTVMDSDKILVMDAGHLAEYDHPYKLLQNNDGILHKLVAQTGSSMELQLHKVARDSYNKRNGNDGGEEVSWSRL